MFESAKARAVGAGYAAGWSMVKSMPPGMSRRMFRRVADAATVRNGAATRQLRANLRRVVGPDTSELDLDALVGAGLRSYARYWLETFTLESIDHAQLIASFDENLSGIEHVDDALAAGTGAILALSHSGNWDASGIWLVNHSGGFTTVAERLEPASVFDRFVAYRESLGMEVIALTGSDKPPMATLTERLRQNKVVCLLADRDLSRNGIQVDFFGEPTRMPAGPALLAATTGAPLLAVHSHFVGEDGWGHHVNPPAPLPGERLRQQVSAATQTMADHFAAGIASKPEDWHMLQRLWLADLPPRPDDAAAKPGILEAAEQS